MRPGRSCLHPSQGVGCPLACAGGGRERTGMAPVGVLAVDDQPIFLRTLRQLVAAAPGFELAGEATSGEEALERAAALHPYLVLLDVRMPGMDGVATARRLLAGELASTVVLISLE